jgi:hypothetical protein
MSDGVVSEHEIMIAELRIVQSLDADGNIHVYDVSQSNDGSEIEPAKALELIEWARASVLAPMVYQMMRVFEDSGEGFDGDESEGYE